MAFNDESVRSKLSALNETQDSIVSVAQWIMFYRRHADRAAQLWLEKLKESNTSKKLNLIYLANEIMQQAKVRRKDDFLVAFMPIIPEGTATAYKGATQEVQLKIRRVVEVWRQRNILDSGIQDATEARIDGLDKDRSSRSTGGKLGGTLFGSSSVPPELQSITNAHSATLKTETASRPLVEKASNDYTEHKKPDAPVPSPPVQAGRLSALMKSLATAEAAVSDGIKARQTLVSELEKLLDAHRTKLTEDESARVTLSERRAETEAKRKEVEDIIFRRVTAEDAEAAAAAGTAASGETSGRGDGANGTNGHGDGAGSDGSPEVEGFTPPPPDVEQLSPPAGAPDADGDQDGAAAEGEDYLESSTYAADTIAEQAVSHDEPAPSSEPPPAAAPSLGADLLSSLSLPAASGGEGGTHGVRRPADSSNPGGEDGYNGAATAEATADPRKRRKTSHQSRALAGGAGAGDDDDAFFGGGEGIGLDEDVAASLGAQ